MKYAQHQSQQLDARQLILDADFDTLALSESTVAEMARHWTDQVSSWLTVTSNRERSQP